MTDLTEKALEDLILDVQELALHQGMVLTIKPRRMFIPKYPKETEEEYKRRVANAQCIATKLLKNAG